MGSTGKSTNYGTITKPDGTVVRLPEKLVYSEDTGSANIPQSVLDFEASHRNSKVENLILYSDTFGVVGTHKGSNKSVSAPMYEHSVADITSHNHPRLSEAEKGWLSGTFSDADIFAFANYHKTDRVTAHEGIYSISKGNNFDSKLVDDYKAYNAGLKKSTEPLVKDIENRLNAEYKKLKSDFNKSLPHDISYAEFEKRYDVFKKNWEKTNAKYQQEVDDLANKTAIASHNWLLENQKKYGYTYGLTRG